MEVRMWAQVLVAPQKFAMVEVPQPAAGDLSEGEVLLRTLAGGICGSDLPNFRGQVSLVVKGGSDSRTAGVPGFPLHEIVGVATASRYPGIAVGDKVVGWASGLNGLAEYVVTSGDGLQAYAPSLDPGVAVMLQPLACVLYALERVPALPGAHVAVIGQGPMGLLFSHVAKSMGARKVTGIDRVDRSDVATCYGVDEVLHASSDRWAAGLRDGSRPGIVIEAIGHQMSTLDHAVTAAASGGIIFYFGVPDDTHYPLPINAFLRKNLTLISGATLERRRMLAAAGTYLAEHPALAESFLTHSFPSDHAEEAFRLASVPAPGRLKVTLAMS
jgi:L-iditol 2-dehydrogenase